MEPTESLPSALAIVADEVATLEAIIDALVPPLIESGPRIPQPHGDEWRYMLLIPGPWCVHLDGPIAPEVLDVGRRAYEVGATEVWITAHELATRPLRQLASVESE